MEANLFWIGIGLGVYAYLLRWLDRATRLLKSPVVSAFLHVLFYGAGGSLVGFIFSASTEIQGPTAKWPMAGVLVGVIWALIQVTNQTAENKGANKLLQDDQEWCETSYSAILLAAVIMYAVLQAFKIPSGSMEDTLLIGDHLFVNKFLYGIRVPLTQKRVFKVRDVHRGDVIVFEAPQSAIMAPDERGRGIKKDFIKRCIGLPGDANLPLNDVLDELADAVEDAVKRLSSDERDDDDAIEAAIHRRLKRECHRHWGRRPIVEATVLRI